MGATEANELKLYIDNDASLHRQQHVPILKNLASKKIKSQYKHGLAVKAFGNLVDSGAKKYAKEFGSPNQPWHKMFDVATRKLAAEDFTRDFEDEFELGNYDHLLPKKHQKELSKQHLVPPAQHAKKKISWRTPEGLRIEWSVPNNAYFALWPTSAPVSRQQVLKTANAAEMDAWLRETYGSQYGRATGRAHSSRRGATHDRLHNPKALRTASNRELRTFYREEKRDAETARSEAARRGITLHARKKSSAQLQREIDEALGRRGRA